ncbi:MAG TPA: hypothetical protein VJN90_01660 [Candidatus Acidoferrales bacterium]|nr:hypothetical protein [Candidatus Acidoferrales bacterium]
MRLKSVFLVIAIFLAGLWAVSPIAPGQTNQPLSQAGAPSKVINIVHEALIPGKESAYADLLARIADSYSRAKIPVYWLTSQSLTGSPDAMSLNFLDSFADAETVLHALGEAMVAHPELMPLQERLLGYTRGVTNALAVRRDDVGYRANTIDLRKARILRVATVVVRQGYESEFAEAMKDLSVAYARVNADSPWVLYQVNAGAPATTFVFIMPMRSLKEMDDYIGRAKRLRDAEGKTVEGRMEEIARTAYVSWDSEIYALNPQDSHVREDFAAGNPSFWKPKK